MVTVSQYLSSISRVVVSGYCSIRMMVTVTGEGRFFLFHHQTENCEFNPFSKYQLVSTCTDSDVFVVCVHVHYNVSRYQ